jgi:hypothetical protein
MKTFLLILSTFYVMNTSAQTVISHVGHLITEPDTAHIDSGIVSNVDVAPLYPGGLNKLFEEVNKIQLTDWVKKENRHGTCWLQFVVEANGFVIKNDWDPDCETLYLKGIGKFYSSMPYWTPAQLNGKKVRCKINIPIHY